MNQRNKLGTSTSIAFFIGCDKDPSNDDRITTVVVVNRIDEFIGDLGGLSTVVCKYCRSGNVGTFRILE